MKPFLARWKKDPNWHAPRFVFSAPSLSRSLVVGETIQERAAASRALQAIGLAGPEIFEALVEEALDAGQPERAATLMAQLVEVLALYDKTDLQRPCVRAHLLAARVSLTSNDVDRALAAIVRAGQADRMNKRNSLAPRGWKSTRLEELAPGLGGLNGAVAAITGKLKSAGKLTKPAKTQPAKTRRTTRKTASRAP